jgi:hypothetical protein
MKPDGRRIKMGKPIYKRLSKPGDKIPQPISGVLGDNLRQNAEPPKPERLPSKTLSDEQERLVAEIKRHHPMATTEAILRDLEAWGWSKSQHTTAKQKQGRKR